MLSSTSIGTKCHLSCIWMIFLAFLVFDAGTFANITFTNYGMKRLSWCNAKKSLWVQTMRKY